VHLNQPMAPDTIHKIALPVAVISPLLPCINHFSLLTKNPRAKMTKPFYSRFIAFVRIYAAEVATDLSFALEAGLVKVLLECVFDVLKHSFGLQQ